MTAPTFTRVEPQPLAVAIYRHGEFDRIIEFPDPRAGFCEAFNKVHAGQAEAVPVALVLDESETLKRP